MFVVNKFLFLPDTNWGSAVFYGWYHVVPIPWGWNMVASHEDATQEHRLLGKKPNQANHAFRYGIAGGDRLDAWRFLIPYLKARAIINHIFTAISAYPWHACMAAYNITSQEGCFTYSPYLFLASPTIKIRWFNISVLRTLRTIQEYRPYMLLFLHCTLPKRILTHPH